MSERDLLIERLERKLAEKERELLELRRMMSGRDDIEKLKAEIISQIRSELPNEKLAELESKVVELRRAIESIITEIAYLKGELKSLTEKDAQKDIPVRKEDKEVESEEDVTYITPEPEKVENDDDDILICD